MTHNVIRFTQIAERYPESDVPDDDEDGSNENETNTKTLLKPKGRYVTFTIYIYTIVRSLHPITSQPGLASVPQSLLTIREEVGLSGET